MLNFGKTYNDNFGTIDLLPFMEDITIRPALNGHIAQVNKKQFRIERYQWNIGEDRNHCYVFVDITLEGGKSKTFAKTPTYVADALKEGKIKITNTIYPIYATK